MTLPRLSKLELKIMNILWKDGDLSIREVQEAFPARKRPAYTTVQTTIYRLEGKGAVERVKKIGNAHIFKAIASRKEAQRRLVDDLLSLFDGRPETVMAHLIESGNLTLEDIKDAEKTLRKITKKKGGA
jgi:BlaI family penicillinase repressor